MADITGAEQFERKPPPLLAVKLDAAAASRLAQAARLTRRTPHAFAQWATALAARYVVLLDALDRYQRGEQSLSELAEETGFAIEELTDAMSARGKLPAKASFDEEMLQRSVETLMAPRKAERTAP